MAKLSSEHWSRIRDEFEKNFANFADVAKRESLMNSRIHLAYAGQKGVKLTYLQEKGSRLGPLGILVTAGYMDGQPSGIMTLKGDERWVFEDSVIVGEAACALMAEWLKTASLEPLRDRYNPRSQEGNLSFWEVSWKLCSPSHPLVTNRRR